MEIMFAVMGFLTTVLFLLHKSLAHGILAHPPQRGILGGKKFAPDLNPIPNAPIDNYAHFPAGNKSIVPLAAKMSQEREGKFNWSEFLPMKSGYHWRAGVCGDLKNDKNPEAHIRGGGLYFGGRITREFEEGDIMQATISILDNGYHNGFMEFHVCDVSKCGGEISESCFRKRHCIHLERTLHASCESRKDAKCAPKDPNYPGRWYLPCRIGNVVFHVFNKIFYRLPCGFSCEHCVLHWFWTSANQCNPPGVVSFFEGNRGPNWGGCHGQGGALGGYTKTKEACGGTLFAEEYYQCADIRIRAKKIAEEISDPDALSSPLPIFEIWADLVE